MNTAHHDQSEAEPGGELEQFIHRWADAIVTNDVTKMERFTTGN
ncbi:hypothetical protein [Agromyces sp. NPDC049794]